MNLLVLRALMVAAVVLLAPAGASASAAEPSASARTVVRGTWFTFNPSLENERHVGGSTIFHLTANVSYDGSLKGVSTVRGILIIHADGSASFHDVEVFTGTVNGKSGTLTFDLFGGADSDGNYHGTQVILRGTGQLAGLHGLIRQTGISTDNGPRGTYTGLVF